MNFRNRITKLEESFQAKNSAMCSCPNSDEMYRQDLTEGSETMQFIDGDGNPYVEGTRICDRCGKEVERHIVFLRLRDADTPVRLS